MDGFHVCDPPMEPRSTSAPSEWQCPECGSWWDVEPSVPAQVSPAFDFLAHQGTVPARWVLRDTG
jgi:hypothetical protein